MHDLSAIYSKVRDCIVTVAKDYFVFGENIQFYPKKPKMTDLEIISLSVAAECLQIDSENLLWSKIKKDYPSLFPNLIHRTKFNLRRKRLTNLLGQCLNDLSDLIHDSVPTDQLIIDSMPLPTCKVVREYQSRAFRNPVKEEIIADKGKNAVMGGWFIGYKFHLITSSSGVYRDFMITSASVHDNYYLKLINRDDTHLKGNELLGDRGYIGKTVQLRLFEELDLDLNIPYRRNQKDFQPYDKSKKIIRKTIEVVFAQYCDEFIIRRNYAKRFSGLFTRIKTKIFAKTFKQYINLINGNPINQTKHALAA